MYIQKVAFWLSAKRFFSSIPVNIIYRFILIPVLEHLSPSAVVVKKEKKEPLSAAEVNLLSSSACGLPLKGDQLNCIVFESKLSIRGQRNGTPINTYCPEHLGRQQFQAGVHQTQHQRSRYGENILSRTVFAEPLWPYLFTQCSCRTAHLLDWWNLWGNIYTRNSVETRNY